MSGLWLLVLTIRELRLPSDSITSTGVPGTCYRSTVVVRIDAQGHFSGH